MAGSRRIVVLGGVLLRVGHVQVSVQQGDVEGCVAVREVLVAESAAPVLTSERAVKHVDGAMVEVGRVQEVRATIVRECEALEDGVRYLNCGGGLGRIRG